MRGDRYKRLKVKLINLNIYQKTSIFELFFSVEKVLDYLFLSFSMLFMFNGFKHSNLK